MDQPVVLVTFSCRTGETEKQALSAAVGAVQARALIRLRRLPGAMSSGGSDTEARMSKEYVAPTEKDVLGADALILAASAETPPAEWTEFLTLLGRLRDEKKLQNKIAAELGLCCVQDLGFIVVRATSADPVALGREVAEAARSLKLNKEKS